MIFKLRFVSFSMLIFILALVIRGGYALVSERIDPFLVQNPLHGDAWSYDLITTSLLNGTGYATRPPQPDGFWPPGYPVFLWLLYSVTGHHLIVGRLANALFGAITCVIVYMLTKRLFNERVSRLTALGAVFFPYHIYFGNWLIAENLFLLLMTGTLLLAVELQKKLRYWQAALLGILVGICILTKPVTIFFLPFAGLYFLISIRSRRLPIIILTALTMVAVVGVWVIRNHVTFGGFSLSKNGGYTFYGANNADAFGGHIEGFPAPIPELSESEQDREYYQLAFEWISQNPGDFASLVVQKYVRLLSPLSVASWREDYPLPFDAVIRLIYWIYLGTIVAGIIISLPQWRKSFILMVPIFGVLLAVFFFYGDTRYTLPAFPSMLIFVSVAIDTLYTRVIRIGDKLETPDLLTGTTSFKGN
jgi:4-amino-4-deoxy-L-arabinose transferase-like glycosyltransferase